MTIQYGLYVTLPSIQALKSLLKNTVLLFMRRNSYWHVGFCCYKEPEPVRTIRPHVPSCIVKTNLSRTGPNPLNNIKMVFYQYGKFHCRNKQDHLISAMEFSMLVNKTTPSTPSIPKYCVRIMALAICRSRYFCIHPWTILYCPPNVNTFNNTYLSILFLSSFPPTLVWWLDLKRVNIHNIQLSPTQFNDSDGGGWDYIS